MTSNTLLSHFFSHLLPLSKVHCDLDRQGLTGTLDDCCIVMLTAISCSWDRSSLLSEMTVMSGRLGPVLREEMTYCQSIKGEYVSCADGVILTTFELHVQALTLYPPEALCQSHTE